VTSARLPKPNFRAADSFRPTVRLSNWQSETVQTELWQFVSRAADCLPTGSIYSRRLQSNCVNAVAVQLTTLPARTPDANLVSKQIGHLTFEVDCLNWGGDFSAPPGLDSLLGSRRLQGTIPGIA